MASELKPGDVTALDPTAVQEAAERLESGYDNWPESLPQALMDGRLVADAYLALTDPAPLTVDVLVGMGFVVRSKSQATWQRSDLIAIQDPHLQTSFAFVTDSLSYVWPAPRTAGELRQLLTRLEPSHAR